MQVFVYVTNVPIVDIVKEVNHARTLSWRLNLSYLYPRHTGGAVPLRCLYGINRSGTAIVAVVPQ